MLKRKNLYVILTTVIIAFLVIVSSFLGLIVYLQWRHLNLVSQYYETLERLDTISYLKNIEVGSLAIRLGFKGLPLVDGKIKNSGGRTVISITLKINFLDRTGKSVYSYVVYPIEPLRSPQFFRKMYPAYLPFLGEISIEPNRTIIFKSILWRCPKKILRALNKSSFSNNAGDWCGKITGEIINVRLKPV